MDTESLEQKEEALVKETVRELGQRNYVLKELRDELNLKEEENAMKQEEVGGYSQFLPQVKWTNNVNLFHIKDRDKIRFHQFTLTLYHNFSLLAQKENVK